jgi:hypothetical protein
MRLDESDIDTFGTESARVTDFAEGSRCGNEPATVQGCQCTPIAAISA